MVSLNVGGKKEGTSIGWCLMIFLCGIDQERWVAEFAVDALVTHVEQESSLTLFGRRVLSLEILVLVPRGQCLPPYFSLSHMLRPILRKLLLPHTQSPHLFARPNVSPSLPLSAEGRCKKWLTQNVNALWLHNGYAIGPLLVLVSF